MKVEVFVVKKEYGRLFIDLDFEDGLTERQRAYRIRQKTKKLLEENPGLFVPTNDPFFQSEFNVFNYHTDVTDVGIERERLLEEFYGCIHEEWKVGCWNVTVENKITGEIRTTQGDNDDKTYNGMFEFGLWLLSDMKEMDLGDYKNLRVVDVWYAGKDNEREWPK